MKFFPNTHLLGEVYVDSIPYLVGQTTIFVGPT